MLIAIAGFVSKHIDVTDIWTDTYQQRIPLYTRRAVTRYEMLKIFRDFKLSRANTFYTQHRAKLTPLGA